MFPVELPDRLIRMFTFWGERVLDPIAASGSTLLAAAEAGRVGVGVESDERWDKVCAERLSAHGLFTVGVGLDELPVRRAIEAARV